MAAPRVVNGAEAANVEHHQVPIQRMVANCEPSRQVDCVLHHDRPLSSIRERRAYVSGISQVPRRSVPCLPGPRPNRRCLASLRFRRCCPRSLHSEGFSVVEISGLPRGFTCCLRFTSDVATTHARLASGGRARLYRKGVEPSGPLQKVSDQFSSSSSGFILAQEGCSSPSAVDALDHPVAALHATHLFHFFVPFE
jgi:hypothetical protein